ncbi:MAG: sulfatase family protein [Opitutaceae bacterium]
MPLNIVMIVADDVSAADIGCYGNPGVRTPDLDRLASEALRFTNAYVTVPSCSPSRCSMLTSRYPHNLETAGELHGALPEGVALFPQLLREAGYYTMHAGKAHFGTNADNGVQTLVGPARAAFDIGGDGEPVPGKGGHGGEEKWLQRLRTRPEGRPFFAWFASHDAHRIWDAGEFTGTHNGADVTVPASLLDTPETRADLALYYDEIARLDHHVGEVIRELERQGVLEQTVVIFLSDHGRPFPRAKTHPYDEGVLTPLIIRMPGGQAAPAVVDALASMIDLAPTILELAGVEAPPSFQGVSLYPILRDPKATVRDFVFAEQNWHNFPAHVRLVRHGDFAYLRNAWPELRLPGASDTFYNPSADALKAAHAEGTPALTPAQANIFQQPRPAEELYDLRADPDQTRNLAGDPGARETLEFLRSVLDRWTTETGDTVPTHPTKPDTIYETGKKYGPVERGEPPGAAAHALRINAPGPVKLSDLP